MKFKLSKDFASIIDNPASEYSMVDADRAMWDYHWVMYRAAFPTYLDNSDNKAIQGRFYQQSSGKTFRSMCQLINTMHMPWK